jgi:hypothetical protein
MEAGLGVLKNRECSQVELPDDVNPKVPPAQPETPPEHPDSGKICIKKRKKRAQPESQVEDG